MARTARAASDSEAHEPVRFVGTSQCQGCHAQEHAKWSGSQHAEAMLEANRASVRGAFDGRTFEADGVKSRFFKRDQTYWVETDGPDGSTQDFEVRYTFGVYPLQQYLIALPGGRLQALGIAWDARPADEGGQRWFQSYPDRKLSAGHPLHWTGIDQNWNYQCAHCHSTDLEKNFDVSTDRFRTTWSEINIGCEGCHGPGSRHVTWATNNSSRHSIADKGLATRFDERKSVVWTMGASGSAERSVERTTNREIEACAACHARRQQVSDAKLMSFFDAFRPALIDQELYYADGQQREEVYTYGSFLQSRMHRAGVTCSDCHDPHSGKLRASGNNVCAQCHDPAKFDTAAHHHHDGAVAGARCVDCHMPTSLYMVVDARHEHSMRIPRPDLTQRLGTPNACNRCHMDKSATWAVEAIKSWYPSPKPGFQTFAQAFDLADRQAPGAQQALKRVVEDASQPAIVRASAVSRLARFLTPALVPLVTGALRDPDPLVRMAAVSALGAADVETRINHLSPVLTDRAAVVRMDAARALAGEAEQNLPAGLRETFAAALAEYVAAQSFNAERPESHYNLGLLHQQRGQGADAESAFRRAMAIDRTFVQAPLALSELLRSRGDEEAAYRILSETRASNLASGPVLYSLGLSLIRQKRIEEALEMLRAASEAAREDPRMAHTYAVALHDTGQWKQALDVLRAALSRHPYDRDLLATAAGYEFRAQEFTSALARAELLVQLEPEAVGFSRMRDTLRRYAR